jgi:hypothetical protein
MALSSMHPTFGAFLQDWELVRDARDGERIVKAKGDKYLPPTQAMRDDGYARGAGPGWDAYTAYKLRALFPEFVSEASEAMIGVLWAKPPQITLPAALEPMRERATSRGESLNMLLRRINEAQLVPGRFGLLLDLPSEPSIEPRPYVVTYEAESIINWDEGRGRTQPRTEEMTVPDSALVDELNLVVLDESDFERLDEFEWEFRRKHRVLVLGSPDVNEPQGDGTYRVGVFRDDEDFSEEALAVPVLRGQPLGRIPFVFVNAKDVLPRPDKAPLRGLAALAMAVYRGEADYRQNLFAQGQDTLVVKGGAGGQYKLGAGAAIEVGVDGDAKFIGVDSSGLPEMRQALENDKMRAANMGSQLLDAHVGRESGESLRVRVAAKTATLTSVALSGAFALERILKYAAEWMGADPDEVVVTPNLDFAEAGPAGQELVALMTARAMGAPISLESIHAWLREREVTTKTFEDEQTVMDGEPDPGPAPGSPTSTNGARGGASNEPRVVSAGMAAP